MKLSEAFPSNYLKSDDLQDRDVTVVIAGAEMEMLGNERKLVLTFQGKKKSMICNKTNAGRIAYLYGEDTDEWIGREIVLTSEFVEFQGKTVKGLRVRPPAKRGNGAVVENKPIGPAPKTAPAKTAPDDMDDAIPF